jgi:predicted MFS family arabinose efflux permease
MAVQALCIGIMDDRLTDIDKRKAIALVEGGRAVGVFCGSALGDLPLRLGGTWRTAFRAGAVLTVTSLVAFPRRGADSDAARRHTGERPHLAPPQWPAAPDQVAGAPTADAYDVGLLVAAAGLVTVLAGPR